MCTNTHLSRIFGVELTCIRCAEVRKLYVGSGGCTNLMTVVYVPNLVWQHELCVVDLQA